MSKIVTRPAEVFLPCQCMLGEGPVFDPRSGVLSFVNIKAEPALHLVDLSKKSDRDFILEQPVGMAALTSHPRRMLAAQGLGFALVDIISGAVEPVLKAVSSDTRTRLNDGKPGPNGCLYVGTMDDACAEPLGSFYMVSPDGSCRELLRDLTISNGIGWSPDHTIMYHVDSPTKKIVAYPFFRERGTIGPGRVIADLSSLQPVVDGYPVVPDGLCVDQEGNLWVAVYGHGKVLKFAPLGNKVLEEITLPAPKPTCCVFGGDNLKTLFVTTAREGMSAEKLEQYPDSGNLFAVELEVAGQASFEFKLP